MYKNMLMILATATMILKTAYTDILCYSGDGADYRGGVNSFTYRGDRYACQYWNSTSPNDHNMTTEYPNAGLEENFCRNPDEGDSPWCYNAHGTTPRWEYCDIPECSDCDGLDRSNVSEWSQDMEINMTSVSLPIPHGDTVSLTCVFGGVPTKAKCQNGELKPIDKDDKLTTEYPTCSIGQVDCDDLAKGGKIGFNFASSVKVKSIKHINHVCLKQDIDLQEEDDEEYEEKISVTSVNECIQKCKDKTAEGGTICYGVTLEKVGKYPKSCWLEYGSPLIGVSDSKYMSIHMDCLGTCVSNSQVEKYVFNATECGTKIETSKDNSSIHFKNELTVTLQSTTLTGVNANVEIYTQPTVNIKVECTLNTTGIANAIWEASNNEVMQKLAKAQVTFEFKVTQIGNTPTNGASSPYPVAAGTVIKFKIVLHQEDASTLPELKIVLKELYAELEGTDTKAYIVKTGIIQDDFEFAQNRIGDKEIDFEFKAFAFSSSSSDPVNIEAILNLCEKNRDEDICPCEPQTERRRKRLGEENNELREVHLSKGPFLFMTKERVSAAQGAACTTSLISSIMLAVLHFF